MGNFYFLIIAVLQVSVKTDVQPITSILPLVFVVLVTMFKQCYEDYKRHQVIQAFGFQLQNPKKTNSVGLLQADNMINRKLVTVVHNNVVKEIQSQEVNIIFSAVQRQFWFPHFKKSVKFSGPRWRYPLC